MILSFFIGIIAIVIGIDSSVMRRHILLLRMRGNSPITRGDVFPKKPRPGKSTETKKQIAPVSKVISLPAPLPLVGGARDKEDAPIFSSVPTTTRESSAAPSLGTVSGGTGTSSLPVRAPMPPLDEKAILSSVVKIECPSKDHRGTYVGSGFVMPHGVVVTAAHLLIDIGSDTCRVIFPKDRAPAYFLSAVTEDRAAVQKRHDEEGIDVAFLFLPLLASYPDAKAIFPDHYPLVPYPVCAGSMLLGDRLLHFGYPGNFLNNSYLSETRGIAVSYADIHGTQEELSEDQTFLFRAPIFSYTVDQSSVHPYMVSRVASFYGDSGGLAFDATRQCILGPHRGGTIGGGEGENFSIFLRLGWDGVRNILP